jgi:phage shock protein A
MTMNKGESTRLDRIEEKIDKLADAVVSIARAEEKLSGLEQLNIEQHRKLQDVEDRLRTVETKVHDVELSMGVLNKIWWIALTAIITGIIGSALFMLGGTAG